MDDYEKLGNYPRQKGCIEVIKYAFYFIPFVSLLWIFSKNFYYLVAVEIFSGIAWSAFGLASSNLTYEYIEPSLRTKYNSQLIFLTSISQFAGSLIGGFLYDNINFTHHSPFLFILAISTIGRFIAFIYFQSIKKNFLKR